MTQLEFFRDFAFFHQLKKNLFPRHFCNSFVNDGSYGRREPKAVSLSFIWHEYFCCAMKSDRKEWLWAVRFSQNSNQPLFTIGTFSQSTCNWNHLKKYPINTFDTFYRGSSAEDLIRLIFWALKRITLHINRVYKVYYKYNLLLY